MGVSMTHRVCSLQLQGPSRTCALEPVSCEVDFAL